MAATYVTMGDARGIGPEVALKALARAEGLGRVRLVGLRDVFARAAKDFRLEPLFLRLEGDLIDVSSAADRRRGVASYYARERRAFTLLPPPLAGAWAGRSIEEAVRVLRPDEGDALVTAPIDKSALLAGGYAFPGHTEMLAALTGVERVAMMLVAGNLRVSFVTGHVPLRRVVGQVKRSRIRDVFFLTHQALRAGFGLREPRIAICGLNPHAGDAGALGDEEDRVVGPAVQALRAKGFHVHGPLSADTVFVRALAGEFDAVLALYHDQGMIPIKVHGFGRGVNLTLGLPFVRTSPDHGTALDIAGSGRARPESFAAALALARDLAARPEFIRPPVYTRRDAV